MNRWHRISRVVLTLMTVALVAAVSVSAAEAGGRGRGHGYSSARYRGGHARTYARPVYRSRVVYSRPYAYAPRVYYRPAYGMYRVGRPVSGGYLAFGTGGLSFGFALSSRPSGYYYMDPYCNTRFSSLGVYQDHCRMHHHDVVVRVIHENAPGRVYQDYDQTPRGDWNDNTPHRDWNDRGDDPGNWNDGNDDSHDENWNDGDDDRRDWNDSGDDDEGDGR